MLEGSESVGTRRLRKQSVRQPQTQPKSGICWWGNCSSAALHGIWLPVATMAVRLSVQVWLVKWKGGTASLRIMEKGIQHSKKGVQWIKCRSHKPSWVRSNRDNPWEWSFFRSCQTDRIVTILWGWGFWGNSKHVISFLLAAGLLALRVTGLSHGAVERGMGRRQVKTSQSLLFSLCFGHVFGKKKINSSDCCKPVVNF